MAIRTVSLTDWLGRRFGADGELVLSSVDEGDEDALWECYWMEAAREIMVSYVVGALSCCEVKFYKDGRHEEACDASWLWNFAPNPNMSHSEFVAELLHQVLIDSPTTAEGEALVVPVKSGGRTHLYLADGWNEVKNPGAASLFRDISVEGSTKVVPWTMSADEVYQFNSASMGFGWHSLWRRVQAQYDAVATVIFKATADRNGRKWFFKMDQPMNGTPEQMELVKRQVRESAVPFVKHTTGVMPLFKGQELARASLDSGRFSGLNAKDISAIRKDMFGLVASAFHMPASMLEGNVNNFDAAFSAFLTFAVDPVARVVSEEITRKTYSREQWRRGCRCRIDTHHIRHVDLFESADALEKLAGAGVDNPNELRGFTGQDPIPEAWADEYQMTKNHEVAGGGNANARKTDAAAEG